MITGDNRGLPNDGQDRVSTQVDEEDIVTFNIGGTKFKTFRSTLERQTVCRLNDRKFLEEHYHRSLGEYFFDRDPDMFKSLMNYLRTGELHLPMNTCVPVIKYDMEFWGLNPQHIEKCCWLNYNEWNATQKALKRLEQQRKYISRGSHTNKPITTSGWTKWRTIGWMFLNDSESSIAAKIFGWISFSFVVVSIFSFLAETTPPFEHYVTSKNVSYNNLVNNTENMSLVSTNISMTPYVNHSTNDLSNATVSENVVKVKTAHPALEVIDWVCLAFFTTEYIIRIVFAPKRLKHVTTMLSVIDLLALLPDYIEFVAYGIKPELRQTTETVGVLTVLRVIRVLRVFRLMRHSSGLWILVFTLRASFSELVLLIWFMGLGILVFSSLIYYTEERSDFESIPAGFWWALITMTTVGYGDMYPKTLLGKIVGSVCAMSGVLMIGFTVPALVNNFMMYYRHIQFSKNTQRDETPETEEDSELTSCDIAHAHELYGEKSWEIGRHSKIANNRVEDVRTMDRLLNKESLANSSAK